MIPLPDQFVIAFLRANIQLEGVVVSWSNDQSVLQSQSGGSTIVIQKTLEDVLFYKIVNAKDKYSELIEKPNKQEDDIKQIAELKNEINELDRSALREKLSTHVPGEMRKTNYGIPSFINKVKGTVERPGTENTRTNTQLGTELQGLFRQERKGN